MTGPAAPGVTGQPRAWLRLEGVALALAGLALYRFWGGDWLLAIPLLLLPDLSMLGYLSNPRLGAFTYNVGHNLAVAAVVTGLGVWLAQPALQIVGAILIAHIGADRALGYGLKYPTSFQDTHLGRIGRDRA